MWIENFDSVLGQFQNVMILWKSIFYYVNYYVFKWININLKKFLFVKFMIFFMAKCDYLTKISQ